MENQLTITDELKTVASMIDVARKAIEDGSGYELNDVYGNSRAACAVLGDVSNKLEALIDAGN